MKRDEIAEILRAHFAALGRQGGKSTSQAKQAAARRNGAKAKRRYCKGCGAELTTADREAGACTQCGKLLKQTKKEKKPCNE